MRLRGICSGAESIEQRLESSCDRTQSVFVGSYTVCSEASHCVTTLSGIHQDIETALQWPNG